MKKTAFAVLGLALFASALPAQAAPRKPISCEQQAARTVARQFREHFYLENGERQRQIELVFCETLVSRRGQPYTKCEVSASNGLGAGDMSFDVMLSADCRTAYAAYITGME